MKSNEPRQLRVLLSFLAFPVMIFLQVARDIVSKMTGNPNYMTPFPPLVDIGAALDDLQAKISAAAGAGKDAIGERNTSWNTARGLMRQLGSYVQTHCQNDSDILQSSGFSATKTPVPIGPLATPADLRFSRNEKTGMLFLRFKPVYGMTAGYTVQVAPAATGPFTDYALSSTTRVEIKGQAPMQVVWFRVAATGAAGTSPWSDPASVPII